MNKELANRISKRVLYEQIAPKQFIQPTFSQPDIAQIDPFKILPKAEYIKRYGEERYYKKLNKLTARIAQEIYDSKQSWESWAKALLSGAMLGDNPKTALNAIRQIRNARHFEQVQSKFKELSGGAGIGQWIASYLGYKWDVFQTFDAEIDWNPKQTINYGRAITRHLKKIGADPETIVAIDARVGDAAITQMVGGDRYETATEIISGEFFIEYKHEIAMAVELTSLLAGGPFGLAISGIAAFVDAKMYWDDGDYYMATLMAVLTLLPGTKLGFKLLKGTRLGRKAIIALAKKIKQIKAGAKPVLTKIEQLFIRALGQPGVGPQLSELMKRAAKSKVGRVSGRVIPTAGEIYVGMKTGEYVTDKIYTAAGLDILEIENETEPLWKQLQQQAQQG